MLDYCGPRFIELEPLSKRVCLGATITRVADLFDGLEFGIRYHFRNPEQLQQVICALGLAQTESPSDAGYRFPIGNRQYISSSAAFIIYLRRLRYKETCLDDLGHPFGLNAAGASLAVSAMAKYLYNNFTSKSFAFKHLGERLENQLESFNAVIKRRFCTYYRDRNAGNNPNTIPKEIAHTVLFVDGSEFQTSRPLNPHGDLQRSTYNARHHHCFEILAVVAPNGLCYGVHGPSVATNDLGMLQESSAAVHFAKLGSYFVLGDAIFPNGANIVRVPNTAEASSRCSREVRCIQGIRGEIEHYFTFKTRFPFLTTPTKLKLNTRPYMHVINAVFLHNLYVCFNGSQVSSVFDLKAPFWRDYIAEQLHYQSK